MAPSLLGCNYINSSINGFPFFSNFFFHVSVTAALWLADTSYHPKADWAGLCNYITQPSASMHAEPGTQLEHSIRTQATTEAESKKQEQKQKQEQNQKQRHKQNQKQQ